SGIGVSFKTLPTLDPVAFSTVNSLPDGWHQLSHESASGPFDYIRDELLLTRCPRPIITTRETLNPWGYQMDRLRANALWLLCRVFRQRRGWIASTGDNALSALEQVLPNCKRVFIFGAHYTTGLGVHDVHMNQGDPQGSQWYASDGIWQDGAVIIRKSD